ncbi:MAG: AAA family ATPase, partial [Actinomycetota bacterium]|nr:AAA family ATPase [Actinomycetota bacterium]
MSDQLESTTATSVRRLALLERGVELGLADAACAEARSGRGSLVLVEGAAGMGKTRLLDAVAERAAASDAVVLSARGGELERGFPYGVVRQLFEPRIARATAAQRDALLAGAASMAGAIFGEPAGDAAVAETPDSFSLIHGLFWLTANLSDDSPLVMVLDDAHWADALSLRFLIYLARRIEELPIMLLISVRPKEPASEHALLTQLFDSKGARVLRLAALSEPGVAQLVRGELSEDADDRFVRACHDATAGNPFYLRELLTSLSADGVAATGEAADAIREVHPETLSRAILLRLSRLPAEATALARAAAVLG